MTVLFAFVGMALPMVGFILVKKIFDGDISQ